LDPAQNNAFRAINQAWKQGGTVHRIPAAGSPAQKLLVRGMSEAAQKEIVETLALVAERTTATADVPALKRPRIGLFRPWGSSMDEGWTRWVLEQYGFEFVSLRPADFKTPLVEKVDVVVLTEDGRIPVEGGGGRGRGGPPGAGGGRAVRAEYADVVSAADLERFEQFVRAGGTVVCLGGAGTFAISQFKLPITNVAAGLRPEEFFLRGSIVEVTVDTTHPLMAGMPAKSALFVDGGPVFETAGEFAGRVLARYQDEGTPLLSGYLIGPSHMNGKAAALDVPLDRGHVILLGFRPQWRGQSFGTLKVLFNALLGR
jgi:ribosomal protein S18 acetylase RimI-like enzyme